MQVSVPSNWRELPGSNAAAVRARGRTGNAGVKSVFTHGVGMGLARNDKRDLRATTDRLHRVHGPRESSIGGRRQVGALPVRSRSAA